VRLIIAWCETRRDFRHFRTDRVIDAKFLEERYPERPSTLRARWKRQITQRAAKAAP
jgi:predicted DNA-binding transcriptional regulator YafY